MNLRDAYKGRHVVRGGRHSPETQWLHPSPVQESWARTSLSAPLDKSAYSSPYCSGVSRPKHFLNYLENAKPTSKPSLQILGNLPRPSSAFVQP